MRNPLLDDESFAKLLFEGHVDVIERVIHGNGFDANSVPLHEDDLRSVGREALWELAQDWTGSPEDFGGWAYYKVLERVRQLVDEARKDPVWTWSGTGWSHETPAEDFLSNFTGDLEWMVRTESGSSPEVTWLSDYKRTYGQSAFDAALASLSETERRIVTLSLSHAKDGHLAYAISSDKLADKLGIERTTRTIRNWRRDALAKFENELEKASQRDV